MKIILRSLGFVMLAACMGWVLAAAVFNDHQPAVDLLQRLFPLLLVLGPVGIGLMVIP